MVSDAVKFIAQADFKYDFHFMMFSLARNGAALH